MSASHAQGVRLHIYIHTQRRNAEAFPLFLIYYPSPPVLRLPADGAVAYASRDELAEASANLMINSGHEDEIVLLTGPKAVTLAGMLRTINEVNGKRIAIEKVSFEEYATVSASDVEGGKSEWSFQKRFSRYQGVSQGDGSTVDPLMEDLPERRPKGVN